MTANNASTKAPALPVQNKHVPNNVAIGFGSAETIDGHRHWPWLVPGGRHQAGSRDQDRRRDRTCSRSHRILLAVLNFPNSPPAPSPNSAQASIPP